MLAKEDAFELDHEARLVKAVYVYEAPVRLWHWVNALCITVLAITGSNGKSTVTTMAGEMCRAAGAIHEFTPVTELYRVCEAVLMVFKEHGDYEHRQRNRSGLRANLGNFGPERKIANGGFATQPLAIHAHQISVGVIVDHRLPCLTVLGATQE